MIYLDSRYADSEVTYTLNPRTNTATATVLRSAPDTEGQGAYGQKYAWREGDRLDEVADKLLGDPSEWWRILDANPDVLNPVAIRPGTLLRIPE